tara:strand:+ start:317 stop:2338 length:2022 start_codon:yes stop_codon:yes gene_type:complete
MTKVELIESLLDYMINLIIENSDDYENFDVDKFRRIFSGGELIHSDGVSETGNIVVFQEDYQKNLVPESIDSVLNSTADCQWNQTTQVYDDWGDFVSFVTYNSPEDEHWSNYDQSLNPDNAPYITIELGECYSGEYSAVINMTESLFGFLSNFITFSNQNYVIDVEKAKQILDTTIFELIPVNITRQARINKFFSEYEALKGLIPNYSLDIDTDDIPDTWASNISQNQDIHHNMNDIQSNDPNNGNIVRLDRHGEQTINEGQTLQSLRDDLNNYLTDIDKTIVVNPNDERPEYENKSEGYLRINGLNQGIIIKQEEGQNLPFVGPDPHNPYWMENGFTIAMWVKFLNKTTTGTLFNLGNPFFGYDENGGYTLPCGPGECEPGLVKPAFALQTFTINKNDLVKPESQNYGTWDEYVNNLKPLSSDGEYPTTFTPSQPFFTESDDERFIRLVVRDQYGSFWDSHVGKSKGRNGFISSRYNNEATVRGLDVPGTPAETNTSETCSGTTGEYCYSKLINHYSIKPYDSNFSQKMLNHLHIPANVNEWYYIVANWNPNIKENRKVQSCGASGEECAPDALTSQRYFDEYWRWHVDYGVDGSEGIKATEADVTSNSDLRVGSDASLPESACQEISDDHPDWPYCYKNIGSYIHNSGEGAKCKVEIISRSDLLRAKGFKS